MKVEDFMHTSAEDEFIDHEATLDMAIHQMGGIEAIRKLLEMGPGARARVSSGYANDPVMSAYGRHGFKGVVPKPYTVQNLSAVLHSVLS